MFCAEWEFYIQMLKPVTWGYRRVDEWIFISKLAEKFKLV